MTTDWQAIVAATAEETGELVLPGNYRISRIGPQRMQKNEQWRLYFDYVEVHYPDTGKTVDYSGWQTALAEWERLTKGGTDDRCRAGWEKRQGD